MRSKPEDIVAMREAGEDEIPRAAAAVAVLAERNGWQVKITYARGIRPGRTPKIVDSIAVKARRGGERIAAVWHDGRCDTALIGTPSLQKVTVAGLRAVLTAPAPGAGRGTTRELNAAGYGPAEGG